nr:hypothetical protein [Gluconacetobacter azotocaptans]
MAGRLICWRLESCWSHATIEIDGMIYSATAPRIVAVPLDDPAFGMPPRDGEAFEVRLSDDEATRALAYCRSMVGSGYDVLAMLGWAFRVRGLQSARRIYCFELVYDAMAAAGVFAASKRLLTGDQLLVDLFETGRIESVPTGTHARAAMQRRPVTVRAPRV